MNEKGVRFLKRYFYFHVFIIMCILIAQPVQARDYIELWPEGWSEVESLFKTGIFADRFRVGYDKAGISFLSMDGSYFRELDLTYRLFDGTTLREEIVLVSQAELDNPLLYIDSDGVRHAAWLKRETNENTICYSTFHVPYKGHDIVEIWNTPHDIQDLNGFFDGDTMHIVWSERDRYFQVKYGRIHNGQLSDVVTISDTSDLSIRPSIVVDKQGVRHIVWFESSQQGVVVYHSFFGEHGWERPQVMGSGSIQDLQQGGAISLIAREDYIEAAWASSHPKTSQLFIYLARIHDDGEIDSPVLLGRGSRPRLVEGSTQSRIIWQGVGRFGPQIHDGVYDGGKVIEQTNLTVGRKAAFRPEVLSIQDYLYVYWLQADTDGGYIVQTINNQYPKPISLWRKIGIDEEAPWVHLLFLLVSTAMLSFVYLIGNVGVALVGGLVYFVLLRWELYGKQPLLYHVFLVGVILCTVCHLPIPSISPQFFGFLHYGLSFVLATAGTYLLLAQTKQRGPFENIVMILLWLTLFQFFALIPQNILR